MSLKITKFAGEFKSTQMGRGLSAESQLLYDALAESLADGNPREVAVPTDELKTKYDRRLRQLGRRLDASVSVIKTAKGLAFKATKKAAPKAAK